MTLKIFKEFDCASAHTRRMGCSSIAISNRAFARILILFSINSYSWVI